ncbi:hypothetical protein B7Y92_02060 [Candidatus Saccharibacteria bacterium 32-50-13]|nr:MAG: hypothetical protein B7Y92_02060 [Candidatus Saccharibacteria bacterium 32-50-13]
MTKNDTTTVNGQLYDTQTGLPVAHATATPRPDRQAVPHKPATSLHGGTQKSKTLRRAQPKKPQPETLSPMVARRPQRRSLDIARHPHVKKVAPTPVKPSEVPDIAPRTHPHVEKANQHVVSKKTAHHPAPHKTMTPKEVKDAEIARALVSAPGKKEKRAKKQRSARHKKVTRLSAIGISIAVILGALVWINLPVLSVHFAASQTGVSATIPHYTPEGFRLQWPVETHDNQVSIKYASADSNTSFTLGQSNSSWNSDAVRTMIEEDSQGRFLTSRDRGITVYTYNGNAAWVNRGILYTIEGDAQLSSDTIMRIANSI